MIEHVVDGCNCSGKRCPGCEQVKCRGVFDPSLLRFDGLQPYCGECRREKRRESHGRDTNREANKRWCQNHRDYNRERNRPHVRNYWERNQEKYRAQSRAYYEANQDRLREQKDTYRRNNLEAYAVREANRRARKAKAGGSFTQQEWHDLCAYYDYTCLRCGRQEPDIELTVDHVIPLSQGGSNDISNLQPLCGACNTRKHTKTIDYRQTFRR